MMNSISVSANVHIHGDLRAEIHLHEAKDSGYLSIGNVYPHVSIHCTAEQARQLANRLSQLADAIEDKYVEHVISNSDETEGLDPFTPPYPAAQS